MERQRETERERRSLMMNGLKKRAGCQGFKGNFTFVHLKCLWAQLFRLGAPCLRVTVDEKRRRPFPFIIKKKESTPSLKCSTKVGLMPSCCPGNKALSGKQWGDWCVPIGCRVRVCVCWRDRLPGSAGRERSRQSSSRGVEGGGGAAGEGAAGWEPKYCR